MSKDAWLLVNEGEALSQKAYLLWTRAKSEERRVRLYSLMNHAGRRAIRRYRKFSQINAGVMIDGLCYHFSLIIALLFVIAALTTWDPRLDPLGVTLQPATDCAAGCWRLISAQFEDPDESQGLHHIWTRTLDEQGSQAASQEWRVTWPGGTATMMSKPAPEWSDFAMFGPGGCYNPENGPGPYAAFVGVEQGKSDVVRGLGLPQCQHVSFRLVWQWQVPLDLPPRLWLPVVGR